MLLLKFFLPGGAAVVSPVTAPTVSSVAKR